MNLSKSNTCMLILPMGTQAADKCGEYRYDDHIAQTHVWFRYSNACSNKNLAKT